MRKNYLGLLGVLAFVSSTAFSAGYYRQADQKHVYYVYDSAKYCHVENDHLMNLLGGHGQVQVVPNISAYTADKTFIKYCSWPNGNYKGRGNANKEVWRNYGDLQTCWISSEASMAQYGGFGSVVLVDYRSQFRANRTALVSDPAAPYPQKHACPFSGI